MQNFTTSNDFLYIISYHLLTKQASISLIKYTKIRRIYEIKVNFVVLLRLLLKINSKK